MIKSEDDAMLTSSILPFEQYMFALTPQYEKRQTRLSDTELGIIPDGRLRTVKGVGLSMREGYMQELNRALERKGIFHEDVLQLGCFVVYFGIVDATDENPDKFKDYAKWKELLAKWAKENNRVTGFVLHMAERNMDTNEISPMHAHVLYEKERDAFDEPQEFIWQSLL